MVTEQWARLNLLLIIFSFREQRRLDLIAKTQFQVKILFNGEEVGCSELLRMSENFQVRSLFMKPFIPQVSLAESNAIIWSFESFESLWSFESFESLWSFEKKIMEENRFLYLKGTIFIVLGGGAAGLPPVDPRRATESDRFPSASSAQKRVQKARPSRRHSNPLSWLVSFIRSFERDYKQFVVIIYS